MALRVRGQRGKVDGVVWITHSPDWKSEQLHPTAMIETEGIDHVALTVTDLSAAVEWYQRILGLERRYDIWNPPIMLGAGTTALALFPQRSGGSDIPSSPAIGFRHLAFRVTRANFDRARAVLGTEQIEYEFQDHDIAHSIYFTDPDGNQLEITTYEIDA